ncbi:MAG: PEGA domain-containing protein [Candidatus Sumerlaeia bacterium]
MRSFGRIAAMAVLAAILLSTTACIRSRLEVTTDPPGATVHFHQQERGDSPITIPFIWYWFYELKVEKEGYETVEKTVFLAPRPWLVMPLDIIMELLPIPIIDTHRRHIELIPLPEFEE